MRWPANTRPSYPRLVPHKYSMLPLQNNSSVRSEKSHVVVYFLTQHSCCKDPFSMVILRHAATVLFLTSPTFRAMASQQATKLSKTRSSQILHAAVAKQLLRAVREISCGCLFPHTAFLLQGSVFDGHPAARCNSAVPDITNLPCDGQPTRDQAIQDSFLTNTPCCRCKTTPPCGQRNLMWLFISSHSIPAARIRFRWSSCGTLQQCDGQPTGDRCKTTPPCGAL